jgi:lipopolysaccharide/colanic/teichoic acid biosynthesis glycosyltransferase
MLIPIILNYRVKYSSAGGRHRSLLEMPVGTGTVLDRLRVALDRVEHADIVVVSAAGGSDEQANRPGSGYRSLSLGDLPEYLRQLETSDYLLVIDPRYWPRQGYDFRPLVEDADYRGATHAVSVGAESTMIRELVECDAAGKVKRVQRYYKPVNWPEMADAAGLYSVVPARTAASASFESVGHLRADLVRRGVLSRDWPVETDLLDLLHEQALLSLHEQILSEVTAGATPKGYAMHSSEVLIGDGCTVHPSVRLIGPVIIQPGARVEEGTAIIGPSLLGADCQIGRCSTIAQAVVTSGANVLPESVCRQRVISGGVVEDTEPGSGDLAGLPPGTFEGDETESSLVSSVMAGRKRVDFVVKRLLDIVLSLVGLFVLSPLLLAAAVLIKLDSPGPVFFRHRRESMGGKEFSCLKFRTMVADAHMQQRELLAQNEVDGPQFKIREDPRVTRIGRWLRGTNLDEVPQLFNVLRGDMSLVGPRPSPFRENQICVSWRMARLSVRPGITGLWQLCRNSQGEGFHEWIHYDILYVRHFSIWLDAKIVLATLLSLGGRRRVNVARLVRQPK